MKPWQWPAAVLLGCFLLVLGVAPATVGAQAQSLTTTLDPQSNSGIRGTATLTDLGGGKTRVAIQVTGAGAGPEPAHIHPGTCAQLDPTPAFTLSSITNGSSTTDVDSSLQQLTSSPFAVHMHKSQDELTVYVACADIVQALNRPGTLPRSGGGPADDWTAPSAVLAGIGLAVAGLVLRRRARSAL